MNNPTPGQIINWCDQLRKLCTAPKGSKAPIDRLEADLLKALQRDERDGTAIDGYPAVTLAEGGGGASIVVEDENGRPDSVPVTTVESAMIQRGESRRVDEVHENASAAFGAMRDAIGSLNTAQTRLTLLGKRSSPDKPLGHSEAICAERHCETPLPEKGAKRGRCPACYLWLYRESVRRGCTIAEVGPVPKSVIDARTEPTKIRVNPITKETEPAA